MASEPLRPWRIITSPEHATVWDGDATLFDFNFQAMGITPDECFKLANKRVLKPGKHQEVHFAAHWIEECEGSDMRRVAQLLDLLTSTHNPALRDGYQHELEVLKARHEDRKARRLTIHATIAGEA